MINHGDKTTKDKYYLSLWINETILIGDMGTRDFCVNQFRP